MIDIVELNEKIKIAIQQREGRILRKKLNEEQRQKLITFIDKTENDRKRQDTTGDIKSNRRK